MKRTKIVCTLGPASQSVPVLKRLLQAGMNVARLNFSHGTYEHHTLLIKNLREASRQTKLPVAVLQDLQGPRVRLGVLPKQGVKLASGTEIVLVYGTDYSARQAQHIPIDYPLYKYVKPAHKILIQDGLIVVKVVRVRAKQIHAHVLQGGVVFSHKGMNIPQVSFVRTAFTAKDKKDVLFGLKHGVDFVALSFVESARDVLSLRRWLQKSAPHSRVGHRPQIVAKIERPAAVRDFARILEMTDAVMVARGDLGIEMPLARVPIIEKDIIRACLRAGKPVIVATQMLESMVRSPRPTRAEVSDVANAVIDHTDAVMLSEETAVGKYPVEAVKMMRDIALSAERSRYDNVALDFFGDDGVTLADNVSEILHKYSGTKKVHVKALLVEAVDANVARMIARQRIELPAFAFTHDRLVYHQLLLSWGVVPVLMPRGLKQDWNVYAFQWLRAQRLVRKGDLLAFVYKRGEVVTKFY